MLTIRYVAEFLCGDRDAILTIARNRAAILIGVLLTLSAGLARHYDSHDLLHEPWVLLGGLGAALLNSLLLYGLFWVTACRKDAVQPEFLKGYRAFLGVFLMTAPMAWLYGIPFERFLEPERAVAANLWTLAGVSAWRVILITRVLSVLYDVFALRTFFLVMLFADIVAFAALALMPRPIIAVMGGIEYAAGERLLAEVAMLSMVVAVLSLPVWLLGALVALRGYRTRWMLTASQDLPKQAISRTLLAVTAFAILSWTAAAISVYSEQSLRARVERLLRSDRVAEALAHMSEHKRDDFPPTWAPPPRPGYGERTPSVTVLATTILEREPAHWVTGLYMPRINRAAKQAVGVYHRDGYWENVERLMNAEDVRPDALPLLRCVRERDASLSEDERAALDRIIQSIQE